ncbi:unnamed protein product [Cylindrotheca closterium]|uniref:SET domain-containing protein n=1 Tax=Cylindrotheca closterium TaxID=2856 RepID=A0AAD2JLD8_9STRA|nr:unnamed protein product [Cylindrotheca closterium]
MSTCIRTLQLFLLATTLASSVCEEINKATRAIELSKWLNEQEGYEFNSKQEIRPIESTIPSPNAGIFATHDIQEGEILARIPWNLIVGPVDGDRLRDAENEEFEEEGPSEASCSAFRNLYGEMQKGSSSMVSPYIDYLFATKATLPYSFSENGKHLLLDILTNSHDEDDVPLLEKLDPPFLLEATACDEEAITTEGHLAAELIVQFAFQSKMIPIYDLYTHRNGKWLNTETETVPGEYFKVKALRDISAGEQIHSSYNDCKECPNNLGHYSVPDIFRDHGFLEPYPQRWSIPGESAHIEYTRDDTGVIDEPNFVYDFETDLVVHDDGKWYWRFSEKNQLVFLDHDEEGEAIVMWDMSNDLVLDELKDSWPSYREELRRISRIRNIEWDKAPETYNITQEEWETIWAFHETYSNILESALDFIEDHSGLSTDHHGHYDDLTHEGDGITYNELDCPSSELIDFMDYDLYEEKSSNYQVMKWQTREEDDDMCLHLDDMLQICTSYRPHYHEYFVHFPAQYIEKVERVMFLGSGDAMLLHEILKYPDLKKVVGLELDQDITRTSFQYFQTQPHYDDPRVEWWYGDATKTLPLLTKEYWGSFDLVLVDLSETVVSLDVTGKHDILDVLENLLKPDGVLLENELYIDRFTSHFDHTIHIFYGSPKVCTQVLTLASNNVDFLHHPIKDHGIDSYLTKTPEEDDERFMYIHDYLKSYAPDDVCSATENEGVVQGRTAGVMEIVNFENIESFPGEDLEQSLISMMELNGFKPLSKPAASVQGHVFVVMEEGYLSVRCWEDKLYCAADINLWGAFSKRETVRELLRSALQSKTVSDYRVVVGGMYGSKTLEMDQKEIGVRFSQNQNCDARRGNMETEIDSETMRVLTQETARIMEGRTDLTAIVVCGFEDEEECEASKVLQSDDTNHFSKVWTIWACPELKTDEDEVEEEAMFACEKNIIAQHDESNSSAFDMLVFDETATYEMMQIFSSIFSDSHEHENFLHPNHILASSFDKSSKFKGRFVAERYRSIPDTIVSVSTIMIRGKGGDELGWMVAYAAEDYSFLKLSKLEERLQARLPGLDLEIQGIVGGEQHVQKDLAPQNMTFTKADYPTLPNEIQNQEQEPLGRQSVVQMQWSDKQASTEKVVEYLTATLKEMHYKPVRFETYEDVGEGCVVAASYAKGSAIMVFDGRQQLVLNLFSFSQSKKRANKFVKTLETLSDGKLKVALRDEQPRGVGRVVNFEKDIYSQVAEME